MERIILSLNDQTSEIPIIEPYFALRAPIDPPLTEAENALVQTAISILPHLGPDATVAYLINAGAAGRHEG